MATSMSDLYGLVRAAVGDYGVYDSEGALVSNSYIFQDAVIQSVMELVITSEFSSYTVAGGEISPEVTANHDKSLIAFWTALYLLIPDRDDYIKMPSGISLSKKDLDHHLGFLVGRIERLIDNGSVPYAADTAWQRLYNAATRRGTQISNITD